MDSYVEMVIKMSYNTKIIIFSFNHLFLFEMYTNLEIREENISPLLN